jgi:hypothetical protein
MSSTVAPRVFRYGIRFAAIQVLYAWRAVTHMGVYDAAVVNVTEKILPVNYNVCSVNYCLLSFCRFHFIVFTVFTASLPLVPYH